MFTLARYHSAMDEFTRYYMRQVGRGEGSGVTTEEQVGPVYRGGFSRGQRGRGVFTSALKGLWDWVSPLFKTGAKTLGSQALDTGSKILSDTLSGENIKDSAKRRLDESRDNLVKKMEGRGRKRKRKSWVKKKNSKRKKRVLRTKGDIFEGI